MSKITFLVTNWLVSTSVFMALGAKMIRMLVFSRYGHLGASSRYRTYQYLPFLRQHGFDVSVSPLLDDSYIKALYFGRRNNIPYILNAYATRVIQMLRSKNFDLIWIEKEALPWLPNWLERAVSSAETPYVVDYDDATFHSYDQHKFKAVKMLLGRKIDQVMRRATLVIAGNDYLAERARAAGASRIEILPTVIDLGKYRAAPQLKNDAFTIGWIGSPSTSPYLSLITPVLKELCGQGDTRVVLVGAGKVELPDAMVQYVPWSEATEVEEIQRFDVGIMPLPDKPWERGKCGLKLIQYMACSRPVVGSPVGVNCKIIEPGVNGFHARTNDEWLRALLTLKGNGEQRQQMGEAGRAIVEGLYSLQVNAPRLIGLLRSAARGKLPVQVE